MHSPIELLSLASNNFLWFLTSNHFLMIQLLNTPLHWNYSWWVSLIFKYQWSVAILFALFLVNHSFLWGSWHIVCMISTLLVGLPPHPSVFSFVIISSPTHLCNTDISHTSSLNPLSCFCMCFSWELIKSHDFNLAHKIWYFKMCLLIMIFEC